MSKYHSWLISSSTVISIVYMKVLRLVCVCAFPIKFMIELGDGVLEIYSRQHLNHWMW